MRDTTEDGRAFGTPQGKAGDQQGPCREGQKNIRDITGRAGEVWGHHSGGQGSSGDTAGRLGKEKYLKSSI